MPKHSNSASSDFRDDRIAISIRETARLAGIGRSTVYQLIASGALESTTIRGRRLVLVASLHQLLQRNIGKAG